MVTEGSIRRNHVRFVKLLPISLALGLSLFLIVARIHAQNAPPNATGQSAPTGALGRQDDKRPPAALSSPGTQPQTQQSATPSQEQQPQSTSVSPNVNKPPNPLGWATLANPDGMVRYDWDGKPVVGDPTQDGFSIDAQDADPSDPSFQHKALKFFAYDFFAPARQIIRARRMRLLGYPYAPSGYSNLNGGLGENDAPGNSPNSIGGGFPDTTANGWPSQNPSQSDQEPGFTNNGIAPDDAGDRIYGQPGYGRNSATSNPTPVQIAAGAGAIGYGASGNPAGAGGADLQGASSGYGPNPAAYPPSGQAFAGPNYSSQGAGSYPGSSYGPTPNTSSQTGEPYGQPYGQSTGEGQTPTGYQAMPPYGGTAYSPRATFGAPGYGDGFTQQGQNPWPSNGQPGMPYGMNGQFGSPNQNGDDMSPIDAYRSVADPLSELTHNVIASVPPNYELEAGDRITVRYWSPTRPVREINQTIGTKGAIVLDGGREVVLRGLTTDQAERTLRQELGRLYRDVEVTVTLTELRTIQVTVSGDAFAPGTYTVPAVSTAFNVLYAAGGPTENGSLRQIEVRRQGRLVGKVDVYKFIMVGAEAHDIRLQPGDLIYIPARVSEVRIDGEVRDPAIYELLDTETLHDALHYAGGVKPSGVDQHIQVSTLLPGQERVLKDIDLRDAKDAALPLYDGDTVHVFSLRTTLANRVTVEGAIDQPGDYAFTSGMKVADLLEEARGALSQAFLGRADLYRWNPDNTTTLIPVDLDKAATGDPEANIPLQRWDRLRIYSQEEVAWTGHHEVTVRGAVQRPGIYYCSKDMRVHDLLLMAGGPAPDAYLKRAVLLHQNGDGTYAYDFIHVDDALSGDPAQDFPVHDNDILALYRVGEAEYTPDHLVSIEGEVVSPGLYPRGDGMHLTDLLKIAGGLKPDAGMSVTVTHLPGDGEDFRKPLPSDKILVSSAGVCAAGDDVELQDGDVITVQGNGGYRDHVELVTINGAVNHPGPIVLSSHNMRLSDAIAAAGGLRPEAFPQGVEFVRQPSLLMTAGQRGLAQIISQLNDILNQTAFQREQAKSDLERIKAAGSAAQPDSGGDLAHRSARCQCAKPLGIGTFRPACAT
jgi:protein involved in polysaccharide export with SLBB domain